MNKKQEAAAIKALKARGYKVEKSVEPPQLGDVVDWGEGPMLICQYDAQEFDQRTHPEAGFFRWGGIMLDEPTYCDLVYLDIREWKSGKVKKLGHVDLSKWMKK